MYVYVVGDFCVVMLVAMCFNLLLASIFYFCSFDFVDYELLLVFFVMD